MFGARNVIISKEQPTEYFARFGYDGTSFSENNISEISLPSTIDLRNKSFSIEVKFRIQKYTYSHTEEYHDHTFFGRLDSTTGTREAMHLTIREQDVLHLGFFASDFSYDTNNGIGTNVWNTAVFLYDLNTTTQKIYHNGVLRAQSASSAYVGLHSWAIGRWRDQVRRQLLGDLAYIRIWDKALSETEITNNNDTRINVAVTNLIANYNFQNNSNDDSGNSYHGTDTNIWYLSS